MKKNIFLAIIAILLSAPYCQAKNPGKILNYTIRAELKNPTLLDQDSFEYRLGKDRGLLLKNQQAFDFVLPQSFAGRIPDYAYIQHRKEFFYLKPDENGNDLDSPWLMVLFHDPLTNEWKTWSDQFGPKKRSAIRSFDRPKKNTLYNFPEFVGKFSPDRAMIVNMAEGDPQRAISSVHKFGLVYLNKIPGETSYKTDFQNYETINSLAIRYVLDRERGLELKQNASFEFVIPDSLQTKPIFHVVLKHRKDPVYAIEKDQPDAFDPNAAYILCEARDRKTGFWHQWADRSSLAKFSEVRNPDNPEDETLHNCLRTFGKIEPDRFKLTNRGTGDPAKCIANIHELEIVFAPGVAGSEKLEKIFTPETAFSNPEKGEPVPLLGGGPRLAGKFPGAILLGNDRQKRILAIKNLEEKYRFPMGEDCGKGYQVNEKGEFLINLPAGKFVEAVELAIGDLDITSLEYNKDGYFGRSGMAEASIFLDCANGQSQPLLQGNNLGMSGMVVSGGPSLPLRTSSGDVIRIRVDNDVAFLMGYRILLKGN